jgi:hypothetical protein
MLNTRRREFIMASPVQIYQAEMHHNLGFYATWLPGDPIEIGDVGVLLDGRFRRLTSLTDLGISYTTSEAGTPQNVQYTSARGTKIGAATSANAAGIAGLEISIEFSADGAFVFHATGLQASRLQELPAVSANVLAAYEEARWRKEWLLIEAVHVADCATIIVSQDSSAGLVLTGSASGPVAVLSLADPKARLDVASSRGKLVHVVGGRTLKPLYSCLRIEHSFFAEPSFAPARGETRRSIEFERAQLAELLDS